MGPVLASARQTGVFDGAAWEAKLKEAEPTDLAGVVKSIESKSAFYADSIRRTTDGDLARSVELSGHAAYRMQLFLYLKSAGRDAPMA